MKERKRFIKKQEDDYHLIQNKFEAQLKQMKQVLGKKATEENKANQEFGKVYHIKNQIE